jgi:hypothetical protein
MSSNIKRRSPRWTWPPISTVPLTHGECSSGAAVRWKNASTWSITGTRGDGALTLDEQFHYDDGSTQRRVWHLARAADGRWHGRAADVKGEALGEVVGNTLRWRYTLLLPVDGNTYKMVFDDWMFLIDDCTMINRASMSKFGVELGQVTLMFRRHTCTP